ERRRTSSVNRRRIGEFGGRSTGRIVWPLGHDVIFLRNASARNSRSALFVELLELTMTSYVGVRPSAATPWPSAISVAAAERNVNPRIGASKVGCRFREKESPIPVERTERRVVVEARG